MKFTTMEAMLDENVAAAAVSHSSICSLRRVGRLLP